MSTIPMSTIIDILPNVISSGGDAIDMNGLGLTNSNRIPIGSVASFPTAGAVGAYFGLASKEYAFSQVYFKGFRNATAVPGALLIAQYPQTAVPAFLRGGNVAGLSLTQLQALSGSLNLTVDGYGRNVANISLAGAVSFSNAATLMQTALNGSAPGNLASYTGAINNGTMSVSVLASGTIVAGTEVTGTGVNGTVIILSQLSGTIGGTGQYAVSGTTIAGSESLVSVAVPITVAYDSTSGGFIFTSGQSGILSTMAFATGVLASSLLLTSAGGAVISQGAAAAVPATFMTGILNVVQNWAYFTTMFDPDAVVGVNTNKLAFAAWTNSTNNRFGYAGWDTNQAPAVSTPAATSFAQQVIAAGYSGIVPLWESGNTYIAAFFLGMVAAINFEQNNGRITMAGKGQDGLTVSVTDPTTAANLIANGYNFYGAYATATKTFMWFQPGSITGEFVWADVYTNQIWMNANFQLALAEQQDQATSIPYIPPGYASIETVLGTPISDALNFGAIRVGVELATNEIQEINSEAGNVNAAQTVQTQGWYLQVLDPGANVRLERGSPIVNFWYADGGAIQKITMSSVAVL